MISGVSASGSGGLFNDRSFSPFGDVYDNYGYNDPLFFAGMNADLFVKPGTGALLYDTPNREFAKNAGRWLSPDPAGLQAVNPTNPQSWNRYSYVLNDPLRAVDPMGLDCVYVAELSEGSEDSPGSNVNVVTVRGDDCPGGGFYFDGTVDSGSIRLNPNGDVVANVDSGSGLTTQCSGDCPDSVISATFSDQGAALNPFAQGIIAANNPDPSKALQQQLKNQSDQCSKAASAAAAPYYNSLKWPSANTITGGAVLGGVAKVATKSTPIGIAISFATVFRDQIGAVVNGSLMYAATSTGCAMSQGAPGTGFF